MSHQTYALRFPILLSPYSRKNDGMREKETLRLALRECEFHQSLYSKIEETLEVYRKLVCGDVCNLLFIVIKRE